MIWSLLLLFLVTLGRLLLWLKAEFLPMARLMRLSRMRLLLSLILGGECFCLRRVSLVVCLGCWPFLALLSVWSGLALAVCLRRWPFLDLISVYISFAPVRGGTYFLCRRKESRQRKRAATASLWVSVSCVNPEWCEDKMCSRTTRVSDKGLIHPTPHYVRRGWVCPGGPGGASHRIQEVLCPSAGRAARRWSG